MRKLTTEKYQEIKQIIADIKSGKKEHNQKVYHCGTAHCIAGWLFVNALERAGMSTAFTSTGGWIDSEGGEHLTALNPLNSDKYVYNYALWAADYLNLDVVYANALLFNMKLELWEIERNLEKINKICYTNAPYLI